MVRAGDTIAVWFSCGAPSAVAAWRTILKYGDTANIRLLNNPVKEEHQDNRRFLRDCEKWLGVTIESVTNPDWPDCSADSVWRKRRYMSDRFGAPCTVQLKKRARQHWEKHNHHDWKVFGFTEEEAYRHYRFVESESDNLLPVLIDEKFVKPECLWVLEQKGIELPLMYRIGFPNPNCVGCVKATSPTYWNHVRKHFPEVFERRARLSRELGVKLVVVKGERIFLDELPPETQGAPMRDLRFDCGLFCEEYRESRYA